AVNSMFERIIGLALAGEEATDCYPLPRPDGHRDLLVGVSAIPADPSAEPRQAVAVVFIADPGTSPVTSPAALAALFGLTPTEARIALGLAAGKRPAAIASELRVAQTTIAFHMRNLFQKTDTSRQAELVALIHSSPALPDAGP